MITNIIKTNRANQGAMPAAALHGPIHGPIFKRAFGLLIRARTLGRPGAGVSIRTLCRERSGWSRSRAALYRHSARGARLISKALNKRWAAAGTADGLEERLGPPCGASEARNAHRRPRAPTTE